MALPLVPSFCPACGNALSRVLGQSAGGGAPLCCQSCGLGVYLDPKVAVAAVVMDEQRALLMRRAQRDSAHGRWILPGGHVDRGEVLEAACRREVVEETGLEVSLERLLGAYSYPGNPVVLIVYLARPVGGRLKASREALEMASFARGDVPWDELGYESTGQALRDAWGM